MTDERREERIDEYVVRDALSQALDSLTDSCSDLIRNAIGIVEGDELTDQQFRATDCMGHSFDISTKLQCELWPDDDADALETNEAVLASARAAALAAAILARLTSLEAQERMRSESARLGALSAREGGRLTVGEEEA